MKRWLALALSIACTLAAVSAQAQVQARGQLPPLQDYFSNPAFLRAELSPNGQYLAAIIGKSEQRDFLAVVDLTTLKSNVAAHFSRSDVAEFQWVNDNRLIFTIGDRSQAAGTIDYAPGLYAIDKDGSNFTHLASSHWRDGAKLPPNTFLFEQSGTQDSNWVYVEHWPIDDDKFVGEIDLKHLNTVTGKWEWVEGPDDSTGWLLDQRGVPRIADVRMQDKLFHYMRDKDGKWDVLTALDGDKETLAVTPIVFASDDLLYVSSMVNDKHVVRKLDLKTRRLGEPLIELEGYDFEGKLYIRDGKLIGMRYTTEGDGNMWFDPVFKAMQAEIDARLPATVNLVTLPKNADSANVLVEAYSDRQPSVYYLYRRDTKQLLKVAEQFPRIDPLQQGTQELVHYAARDGLSIPALLTLPPGGKRIKRPLVLLVHGGPYIRGPKWGWRPETQFLASRGYAVLEPFFRGSTGFGLAHFKAGWKQWGLKMQDDIADGAAWAVANGYADDKRICIAGGSYGGYSALMGVLNDPGIFKCAVDWAGVTDIELLYKGHWFYTSDLPAQWKQYGMPVLIGDLKEDAAQLKATSPLQQAARIKRPLLLAYGDSDHRVPVVHGTRFYRAVREYNKDVEYIEYDDEGHGWKLPKNRIDFWSRVEKFLDKNIGPGAKTE